MNEKMRTFELDGKKRGVRLDAHTWEALDLLASQSGSKWAALARQWAETDPEEAKDNLTAVIRAGVMAGMLAALQKGGTATATATATKTPGAVRVDWTCGATTGSFLLDAQATDDLIKALESARPTTAQFDQTGAILNPAELIAMFKEELMQCTDDEPERREKLLSLIGKLTLVDANPHLYND